MVTFMDDETQNDVADEKKSAFPSQRAVALLCFVVVAAIVTFAFIEVIYPFLSALALAAIFAILSQPLYKAVLKKCGERRGIASAVTVLIGITLVVAPLLAIGNLAASYALEFVNDSDSKIDAISEDIEALKTGTFVFPDWVPFQQNLTEGSQKVFESLQGGMSSVAAFVASEFSGFSSGTAKFFLSLFTFVYALFFFLQREGSAFRPILETSGLPVELQEKLHERIVSVSRATIKGTLVIGAIQGALGGLGFWVAGIDGPIFWAVVMAIAAAIPGIGATAVVFCGAIFLAIQGDLIPALCLALWAGLVVGTIDNFLRPTLVGKDAQMSDLMIFVSTLGGLAMFGAPGLVFGPVIAGLFVTIWEAVPDIALWMNGKNPDLVIVSSEEVTAIKEPDPLASPLPSKKSKLTATKSELEAEVETLRRELDRD